MIEKYITISNSNGPENFSTFVTGKHDIVHNELFENALKKYAESENVDYDEFKKSNKIIELKDENYSKPSSVIIISKSFPYTKKTVNLEKWWNEYQFDEHNKDISDLFVDKDMLVDAKLVYINYVTGKCKFKSKISNEEFWTTIDYINANTEIDEDNMTLKNTFTYMLSDK